MTIYHRLIELGCTRVRHATSYGSVSYWVIPGGSDYEAARCGRVYFPKEIESAVLAFVEANNYPPEMPFAITLEEYDKIHKLGSES